MSAAGPIRAAALPPARPEPAWPAPGGLTPAPPGAERPPPRPRADARCRRSASSGDRHPDPALLPKQRHRLELEPVVVHRAARPGAGNTSVRSLGSSAHRRSVSHRAAPPRNPRTHRGRPAAFRRRWPRRARRPATDTAASSPSGSPPTESTSNQAGGSWRGRGHDRELDARWRRGAGDHRQTRSVDRLGAIPSTSRPTRSGAASSRACLMASSSVTDEAEQSEQLPRRWIRATPSSSESSSTLPPWDSM